MLRRVFARTPFTGNICLAPQSARPMRRLTVTPDGSATVRDAATFPGFSAQTKTARSNPA